MLAEEQLTGLAWATVHADGEVIDGDPHKVIDKVDVWTFERDLKSQDPNWMLVATAMDE